MAEITSAIRSRRRTAASSSIIDRPPWKRAPEHPPAYAGRPNETGPAYRHRAHRQAADQQYRRRPIRRGPQLVLRQIGDGFFAQSSSTKAFPALAANIVRLECAAPPENGVPSLGQLLVNATSPELGDNTGTLDASVQGSGGQIAFNCRYLRDALEVLATPQVSFQFSGGHQPGVLRPVGDGNDAQMHVVMPLVTPTR